ncbi:S phase cyclin A-associated protein in the endoplasmic reticulum-like isoform X2 [Ptychodera flava]|uniref:S phase cyclin A-associated protein in the endoplasmic reticulum-like isoform X2 n=1 Tax=Ptychodera flava TaxID=63121 RepID=UPI00396A324C
MSERKRRGNSGGKPRPNSAGENMKGEREVNSISRSKNSGFSSSYKSNYQRTNSYDKVRKLVEEEGRTARNLVAWSVPFDDSDDSDSQAVKARVPRKLKPRSLQGDTQRKVSKGLRDGSGGRSAGKPTSPTKPAKKVDVRARYWAFLFDNLQRAVDEIYQTCEADESIVECKEVIMMLKNCTRDFESLIERIQLQTAFENTEVQNRPTSLAWEVRKTSPGKPLGLTPGGDKGATSPVNRSLNFAASAAIKQGAPIKTSSPSPGSSWADKVKGAVTKPVQIQESPTVVKNKDKQTHDTVKDAKDENAEGLDDGEGWETVQRKHKESKQNKLRQLQGSPRSHSMSNGTTDHRTNEHYTVPRTCKSLDCRTRADSEKENEPDRNSVNVMTRETKSASELEKELKATLQIGLVIQKEESGDSKVQGVMGNAAEVKEVDGEVFTETRNEESSKSDISGTPTAGTDSGTSSGDVQLNSEDTETREVLNDDSERLAAQLHDAMVAVLDEESLTTELEKCHEEALASALEEEANLTKEIEEEESKEINVETENEEDSDLGNTASSMELSQRLDWNDIIDQYDSREQSSWGDMVEVEERTPGHALHMHEKLSSPSRKRTRAESQRRHEEKQAKAHQLRVKLTEDKKQTLRMLNERINEVRAWKAELYRQRKKEMGDKLKRAEAKRNLQLQAVVRKAQEEEAKVNEIAFINSLEAQNKRLDIMTRHEVNEARLQDIQEERQRRQEEKAAKEEAAHERRRALEEERLAKLEAMQKHREQQESKINFIRMQRDRAREDAAKEKAREREMRLAALDAAQKAKEEEIQKKIQQKHDESSKRHSKLIEERRERAMELSTLRHFASTDIAPKQKPFERKKSCTMCNVLIPSEVYLLSHLHGKKHKEMIQESIKGKTLTQEELENHSIKYIVDAPEDGPDPQLMAEKERQRAFRKRARKIRQRMTSKGKVYENNVQSKSAGTESENKAKLQKVVKDINKYLQSQGSGPWPANRVSALDRALGEISRILDKKVQADQLAFCLCGGLTTLSRVLLLIGDSTETKPPVLPVKTLCNTAHVFNLACKGCFDNCINMLCGNKLGPMVDMLMHRLCLLIPEQGNPRMGGVAAQAESATLPHDQVAAGLMQLISSVLSCVSKNIPSIISRAGSSTSVNISPTAGKVPSQADTLQQWGLDIVSYLVCVGVVDKLTCYFQNVHGPVDEDAKAAEFLENCLGLLVSMTRFITTRSISVFDINKKEDTTQLMVTLKSTQFAGIISMLYGILLHGGAPSRKGSIVPPELPEHTLRVVNTGLRMMNTFAVIDLKMLQSVLGEEGISLEFRHIATYLIWYCSHWTQNEELCHEVMLIVGYFTVLDHDNQLIVQSGNTPTLLQQLCSLPFQYFSNPRLMNVLFPTLIACCYDNAATKKILEQEMSCSLLASFIEEKTREKEKLKILPSSAKTKDKEKDGMGRMSLESRFPISSWEDAKKFFEDK